MEEEKKSEFEKVQTNETVKEKKNINKFLINYIVFVIILIAITVFGIYFTIKYMDKIVIENQLTEDSNLENNNEIKEEKNVAEDKKYAINSYSETYNTNSLEIKHYYDLDGNITRKDPYSGYETRIQFIQIDGLKNKDIQDRINAKLKNTPYTLEKEKYVWSDVRANFSNVLAVDFVSDKENESKVLNIDLTTGEEIPFEKLFISSAPIKSMIATGMYEDFAWEKLYEDYVGYDGVYDMENADTSEIEEEFFLAAKKYDKIKNKIIFTFDPTSIYIQNPEIRCAIDMAKYANEIAIYKRYLTERSIYENDDLGTKGTIVFTEDITRYGDVAKQISYGQISDNIFVEEVLWKWDESLQEEDMKTIINYVNKLSTERKTVLKEDVPSNKGVIFQGTYTVYKDADKGYYEIMVNYHKAQCSLSYFKEEAFRDYIEVKGRERADVGLNMFDTYMQEKYPEMQISEVENKIYYLSSTGEFLGNTQEEADSKIWE